MSLPPSPLVDNRLQLYRPLVESKAIRIVVVQPNNDGTGQIECILEHATLDYYDNEIIDHFIALSYVWGDQNDTRNIIVDGHIVDVTANLEAALRHIRDEKRPIRVWADALCINQLDDDEKNVQVGQMGRVYSTAHHTVIYLGSLNVETSILLDEMQQLYRNPRIYELNRIKKTTSSEKALCLSAIEIHVLSRPWFTRIWVLQELVRSRDPWIQFDRKRVRWQNLLILTSMLVTSLKSISSFKWLSAFGTSKEPSSIKESGKAGQALTMRRIASLEYMESARNVFQDRKATTSSLDLINLLQARRGFGASDARDFVYAHFGVAADFNSPEWPDPIVDYSKTTSQVFTDIARYFIQRYNDLRIISYVGAVDPVDQVLRGIPSWVPDWTKDDGPVPSPIHSDSDRSFFYSHHNIRYQGQSKNILVCQGMIIGRVLEVGRSTASLRNLNGCGIKKEWATYRLQMRNIKTEAIRKLAFSKKKPASNRGSRQKVRFPESFDKKLADSFNIGGGLRGRLPAAKKASFHTRGSRRRASTSSEEDKVEELIRYQLDNKLLSSYLSYNSPQDTEPCLRSLLKIFSAAAGLHEPLHHWPTEWPTEWPNEKSGVAVQQKLGATQFLSLLFDPYFQDFVKWFVKNKVPPLAVLSYLLFRSLKPADWGKLKEGPIEWDSKKSFENLAMFQDTCRGSNVCVIDIVDKQVDLSSDSEPEPSLLQTSGDDGEWETDSSDGSDKSYKGSTLAITPASSQPGDLICVLEGTKGYFVIRPFTIESENVGKGKEKEKSFIVIGSCFLTFELYITWDTIQNVETLIFH
ncbi:hypothetical protein B7463_g3421, partial [Scytalidium lignicola]